MTWYTDKKIPIAFALIVCGLVVYHPKARAVKLDDGAFITADFRRMEAHTGAGGSMCDGLIHTCEWIRTTHGECKELFDTAKSSDLTPCKTTHWLHWINMIAAFAGTFCLIKMFDNRAANQDSAYWNYAACALFGLVVLFTIVTMSFLGDKKGIEKLGPSVKSVNFFEALISSLTSLVLSSIIITTGVYGEFMNGGKSVWNNDMGYAMGNVMG